MQNYTPGPDLYSLMLAKAAEVEEELKRLNRWQQEPLDSKKFENMGAFGANTMAFEQWLQFVLIPRIQQIIDAKDDFPSDSMLSTYGVRAFDGDHDADRLNQLLSDIDQLINGEQDQPSGIELYNESSTEDNGVTIDDTTIPTVVYVLAEVLHQFEGDALESQLQTFDIFLNILAPSARPIICELLQHAAERTANVVSKARIEQASVSIASGGRAADLYNHEEVIRRYQEEHKKNFPNV